MRIAILADRIPPEGAGGAERVAWELAKAYAREGNGILVVTTTEDRETAGETEEEGVRVIRIHSRYHTRWRAWRSLYNPQTVPLIRKALTEFKPEIVHAHNVHAHLSYASFGIAKRTGARVFLTAHDAMLYAYGKVDSAAKRHWWQDLLEYRLRYDPFRNIFIRRALRNVEKVIAVSEALAEALRTNAVKDIAVIHNGIDADAWRCPPDVIEAFEKEYGIGAHTILFGGRLSGPKGGGRLLQALPEVLKEVPHAKLVVMGHKDRYAETMLEEAQREGIADRVIFTGYLSGEGLRAAYHAAALVAVPSLYLDPFPTVVLEAMACGRAVVATALGGAKEALEDGVTGLIVDPRAGRDLAEALVSVLSDPARSAKMGSAGHARVASEFTLRSQAERYISLFRL